MSTAAVQAMPTLDLTRLTEAFRQMGESLRRVFSGMHGNPEAALNRRLLLGATLRLDAALGDARKTLNLRHDPDLATLPYESRAYVSGRLDPAWDEHLITLAAAGWYLRACRMPCDWTDQQAARITLALLEGWADRGR